LREPQPVRLVQQTDADRQPLERTQPPAHAPEGAEVVGDFLDIVGVVTAKPSTLAQTLRSKRACSKGALTRVTGEVWPITGEISAPSR
jgi:hypothetical protein